MSVRILYFVPAYRGTINMESAYTMASDFVAAAQAGVEIIAGNVDVCHLDIARNQAIEKAVATGCQYVLMLDNDNYVADSAPGLPRLMHHMNEYDAAVMAAAYLNRDGVRVNAWPRKPGEVYEGDGPSGYMLINVARLKDLPRPWFLMKPNADGTALDLGNDIGFCRYVREHGYRAMIDYTIPIGHVGRAHHVTLQER